MDKKVPGIVQPCGVLLRPPAGSSMHCCSLTTGPGVQCQASSRDVPASLISDCERLLHPADSHLLMVHRTRAGGGPTATPAATAAIRTPQQYPPLDSPQWRCQQPPAALRAACAGGPPPCWLQRWPAALPLPLPAACEPPSPAPWPPAPWSCLSPRSFGILPPRPCRRPPPRYHAPVKRNHA
jgi:hypothetical protein